MFHQIFADKIAAGRFTRADSSGERTAFSLHQKSTCADNLNVRGAPGSKYPPSDCVTSRQ